MSAAARSHLSGLQALLQAVPPQHRAPVTEFWRQVRDTLNQQDQEIAELRAQLGPGAPASRPATRDSVVQIRSTITAQLEQIGQSMAEGDVSGTIESVWNMPPDVATSLLQSRRDSRQSNAFGCWFSANVPAHPMGYQKINLRNTRRSDGRGTYGCQPWLHQLAIIAKGDGIQLLNCSDHNGPPTHTVSHLCHQTGCFNPGHIIVEPAWLNEDRKRCKGRWIVNCGCGAVYNPCPHGQMDLHINCMLPVYRSRNGPRYYSSNQGGYF